MTQRKKSLESSDEDTNDVEQNKEEPINDEEGEGEEEEYEDDVDNIVEDDADAIVNAEGEDEEKESVDAEKESVGEDDKTDITDDAQKMDITDCVIDTEEEYIDEENVIKERVPDNMRISKAILTTYERTRIIGERASMLKNGAPPLVKNTQGLSEEAIAKIELEENVMPFKIRRPLPNNKYEVWKLSELKH